MHVLIIGAGAAGAAGTLTGSACTAGAAGTSALGAGTGAAAGSALGTGTALGASVRSTTSTGPLMDAPRRGRSVRMRTVTPSFVSVITAL